jgi:hypothetical protein
MPKNIQRVYFVFTRTLGLRVLHDSSSWNKEFYSLCTFFVIYERKLGWRVNYNLKSVINYARDILKNCSQKFLSCMMKTSQELVEVHSFLFITVQSQQNLWELLHSKLLPRSGILEKLIVAQLITKWPAFLQNPKVQSRVCRSQSASVACYTLSLSLRATRRHKRVLRTTAAEFWTVLRIYWHVTSWASHLRFLALSLRVTRPSSWRSV